MHYNQWHRVFFFNAESTETLGQKVANLENVLSSFPSEQSGASQTENWIWISTVSTYLPLCSFSMVKWWCFHYQEWCGCKIEWGQKLWCWKQIGWSTQKPQLCIALAAIFVGWGHSGAKVTMTTLERDSGLFVVHIDLRNDQHDTDVTEDTSSTWKNSVKGAICLES